MAKPQNVPYRFTELARAQIGENHWLVISRRNDGKYVQARATVTRVDGKEETMFFPDPLVIQSLPGLEEAANAFMAAIEKAQSLEERMQSVNK